MPVVTTRPRALAASAGRTPRQGLRPLRSASQILSVLTVGFIHTFSMLSRSLSTFEYVVSDTGASLADSGAAGRAHRATRVAKWDRGLK